MQDSPPIKRIFFLIFLFLTSLPVFAIQIELKNGDQISGVLQKLTPNECIVSTSYNSNINLPNQYINTLKINNKVLVELKTGERLSGEFKFKNKQVFQLISPYFGSVNINWDELLYISTYKNEEKTILALHAKGIDTPSEKEKEKTGILGNPPENYHQLFLRQSTVLLQPGQIEAEIAISYDRQQLIPQVSRQVGFFSSLMYGINRYTELSLNIPYLWAQRDTADNNIEEKGRGNIGIGFKHLFIQEKGWQPDIIGQLSISAPSGDKSNPNDPKSLILGGNYWSVSTGIHAVKSHDPVVLFGGLSYVYRSSFNSHEQHFKVGNSFRYNFGLGFAINNRISLSGQFSGEFIEKSKLNGKESVYPAFEPMSFRSALTYRLPDDYLIEPSLTFGLNDDAPDSVLSLAISHRF